MHLTKTTAGALAALALVPSVAFAATINGGPGNERLKGTRFADRIDGGGGNDRIFGLAGNDVLIGGQGNDRIFGGPGDDQIFGVQGNDWLYGGPGNVILDNCDACGVNWLDDGELQRILGAPDPR